MSGGEIIYFELAAAGTLMETEKREIGGDIVSLDVAPVPTGRQRSRFLAVGSSDSTVSRFTCPVSLYATSWLKFSNNIYSAYSQFACSSFV